VVTGQIGKSPSVHVWDAHTCEKISSFQLSPDSRGVQAVSISPCKRYVAAVDMSNDHKVYVQNIERNCLLLVTEGGKEKILDVQWSKKIDDLRFATVGLKELKFWHPADVTRRLNQKGTF
jgi:WD40 repeat protein